MATITPADVWLFDATLPFSQRFFIDFRRFSYLVQPDQELPMYTHTPVATPLFFFARIWPLRRTRHWREQAGRRPSRLGRGFALMDRSVAPG